MSYEQDLEARLQQLIAKRGQELVRGLVDEVTHLHREIAALRRELAALTDFQAMRDRWLVVDGATAARAEHLPVSVTIEPDQLLHPRDGFYPLEYTGDGRAFRWTGPGPQFSFDIFVERAHGADLKLEALNCIDFEKQKDLMLLVDGQPVPFEMTQTGMGFEVAALLPARSEGLSTNLVFLLPAALPPPEGLDTRLLGIAFGRLDVVSRSKGAEPTAQ